MLTGAGCVVIDHARDQAKGKNYPAEDCDVRRRATPRIFRRDMVEMQFRRHFVDAQKQHCWDHHPRHRQPVRVEKLEQKCRLHPEGQSVEKAGGVTRVHGLGVRCPRARASAPAAIA